MIRPFISRRKDGIILHCRNRTERKLSLWERLLLYFNWTNALKLDKTKPNENPKTQ